MNPLELLKLLGGKNPFELVSKILVLVAGFLAAADENNDGPDDLAAGALFSISSGLDAYARKDDNEHGNIVDGLIAGLQEYRTQMVKAGKIFPVNHVAKT